MGSCSLSSEEAAAVVTVDVHAAQALIGPGGGNGGGGHRYLDVRTEEEFKKGHLENAINVPYMFFTPQGRVKNQEFVEQVSSVCNKEDLILLGCQSGVRSLQASVDLLNAGFKNVKNMGGGYAAWVENGFAVKRLEYELNSTFETETEEAASVDIHTAEVLIGSGHYYLDVRTVEEFNKGHLENSLNVPYMFFTPQGKPFFLRSLSVLIFNPFYCNDELGRVKNQEFVEQVSLVCNKEDQIVVGSQSGVRSLQATTDLLKAGFKNVKNMEGCYAALVENGFDAKKLENDM